MHGRLTSLVAVLFVAVSVNALAQDIPLPGTPTNLQADPGGSSVDFTWTPPTAGPVDKYRLTMTPINDPTKAVTVDTPGPTPSHTVVSLPDGTYDAVVQAVNTTGPGFPSNPPVRFSIAPAGPPENFAATVTGNSVFFVWTESSTGPPPETYQIEIGIPGEETIYTVPGFPGTSGTVSLPNGVYVARAKGVEAERPGTPSPDITFIVGPPPTGAVPFPPSGLVSEIIGNTVTLRWNMRVDSPPVSSFLVQVSTSGGAPLGEIDIRSTARSVTFTNVPNGSYAVRVSSYNVHGRSQRSSATIFVAVNTGGPSCGTQLEAPTGLSYSKSGNFVALTWARPANGASITDYLIDVSGTLNTTFSTGNQSTVIGGTVPSGFYTVQVRSHDACSASAPSNQVFITVP
jgi:hypothetical protein